MHKKATQFLPLFLYLQVMHYVCLISQKQKQDGEANFKLFA